MKTMQRDSLDRLSLFYAEDMMSHSIIYILCIFANIIMRFAPVRGCVCVCVCVCARTGREKRYMLI